MPVSFSSCIEQVSRAISYKSFQIFPVFIVLRKFPENNRQPLQKPIRCHEPRTLWPVASECVKTWNPEVQTVLPAV